MALGDDYRGCSVLIYTQEGTHICDGIISVHDRKMDWIDLRAGLPSELKLDDFCSLLILSAPIPCEYQARVIKDSGKNVLSLFKGKEKENRKRTRYAVNFQASIEALIIDETEVPLYEFQTVTVINISRAGVRFKAAKNTILQGHKFKLRMKIDSDNRLFTALVINSVDISETEAEYGCSLIPF